MRTTQTTDTDTAARLRAVISRLSRRMRPAVEGLTPTRVSVLFTVAKLGPLRLTRVAEVEGLNPTMLSRVVGELCAQGLLRRTPDPDDGRAALVAATDAGLALCDRIRDERTDVLNVQLARLGADERALLERALPVLEVLTERLKDPRA